MRRAAVKFKQRSFRPEDLVACTEPIYHWGCPGCYAELSLKRSDPRAAAELAPKCDRCGDFMVPVEVDAKQRAN